MIPCSCLESPNSFPLGLCDPHRGIHIQSHAYLYKYASPSGLLQKLTPPLLGIHWHTNGFTSQRFGTCYFLCPKHPGPPSSPVLGDVPNVASTDKPSTKSSLLKIRCLLIFLIDSVLTLHAFQFYIYSCIY